MPYRATTSSIGLACFSAGVSIRAGPVAILANGRAIGLCGDTQQLRWQGIQPARWLAQLGFAAPLALAAVRGEESLPHTSHCDVKESQLELQCIVILQRMLMGDQAFFNPHQKCRSPFTALTLMNGAQAHRFILTGQ